MISLSAKWVSFYLKKTCIIFSNCDGFELNNSAKKKLVISKKIDFDILN